MRLATWLDDAMGSPTRVRILRYLDRSPRREHTLQDVARGVGSGPSSARVALRALVDVGLVELRRLGGTHAYSLRKGLVRRCLREIFARERLIEGQALESLRRVAPAGVTVVLFGSAVRGGQTPISDLDVLVVAPTEAGAARAVEAGREALERVGPLRARFLSLGLAEFRRKRHLAWLGNAIRDGIRLVGPALDGGR